MYIFSTRFIYIVFLLGLVATNLMFWFEVIDHYSFICLQLNMNVTLLKMYICDNLW